ncbi:hypothetical protein C475_01921 [Halosimplex carlsbadense 2-9-1]|uniref:Uncharacterized protein n=1 Tax=Halosimplex carlsbadense 2-9-1 TaxID=797114 RepID=M0D4Q3_9EURY|nr:hypothetical protein [Halosimplex carlsbadense]ELZ29667.1 hypothetical protein C475_01921 [Halosimplex carlsbadense 2-9-1]
MAAGTQSRFAAEPDVESRDRPEISVCEGAPGTAVFLESGNTDGWIASDTTLAVTQ